MKIEEVAGKWALLAFSEKSICYDDPAMWGNTSQALSHHWRLKMMLLQQKRLADLRLQLERTLDKRDETLDRLVRLTTKVKALTKAVERAQKRMAAAPKPVARPAVIAPPAPTPDNLAGYHPKQSDAERIKRGALDDEMPDFLRRSRPDAVGQQIAAEIEARHKAKSRGRIATMKAKKSGETKRMPLEGKDALKAIFG